MFTCAGRLFFFCVCCSIPYHSGIIACVEFIYKIFVGFKTRLLIYFMVQQLCIPCTQHGQLIYIGFVRLNSRHENHRATTNNNPTIKCHKNEHALASVRTAKLEEKLHSLTVNPQSVLFLSKIFWGCLADSLWLMWMLLFINIVSHSAI